MSVEAYLQCGQRAAAAIGAALTLFACAPAGTEAGAPPLQAPAIEAPRPAAAETPAETLDRSRPTYPGVVVPRQAVDVAAPFPGRVESIQVYVGDRVERGGVLARLDTAALGEDLRMAEAAVGAAEAERRQAAASLAAAEARWRRRVELAESYSQEEIEATRTERDTAAAAHGAAGARVDEQRARVRQLRDLVAQAVVTAPFAATVGRRHLEPGAAVATGTPIVRLLTADDLLVRFAVPPADAAALVAGTVVILHLAGEAEAQAVVERVAPEIDAPSQRIFVEAKPSEPATLASGAALRVSLAAPDGESPAPR